MVEAGSFDIHTVQPTGRGSEEVEGKQIAFFKNVFWKLGHWLTLRFKESWGAMCSAKTQRDQSPSPKRKKWRMGTTLSLCHDPQSISGTPRARNLRF